MGDTPIISLWRFEFTKVWSLPLHRTVAVFVMEELHVQGMIVGWTSKVIHVCRPKLARIHQQQRQQRQGADWDEARNPIGSCAPARASWHVSFRLGRRYHGLIGTLFFAYTWFWGSTLNIDFFSVDTFLFKALRLCHTLSHSMRLCSIASFSWLHANTGQLLAHRCHISSGNHVRALANSQCFFKANPPAITWLTLINAVADASATHPS